MADPASGRIVDHPKAVGAPSPTRRQLGHSSAALGGNLRGGYGKLLFVPQFDGEPGAGVGPPGIRGAGRYSKNVGALRESQPAEVPQLDKLGEFGVFDR
jgi:hypothetical protein